MCLRATGCRLAIAFLSLSLVFGIQVLLVHAFGPFDTVQIGTFQVSVDWISWENLTLISAGLLVVGILFLVCPGIWEKSVLKAMMSGTYGRQPDLVIWPSSGRA
jgi:hypothetical protein